MYFFTSSTLPCCFQDSSLDSQPSSPLPAWSGYRWLQPQPSNGTALPWPSRGISPRAAAIQVAIHRRKEPEASWLGEVEVGKIELHNGVTQWCFNTMPFITHFIVQLYTLHTSTWWTTDANVALFFDFYFGPIHIEHHLEVRWDCKSLVHRASSVFWSFSSWYGTPNPPFGMDGLKFGNMELTNWRHQMMKHRFSEASVNSLQLIYNYQLIKCWHLLTERAPWSTTPPAEPINSLLPRVCCSRALVHGQTPAKSCVGSDRRWGTSCILLSYTSWYW